MTGVEFTDYSPLSASAEVTRRLLSPLAAAQVARVLERSGERLAAQSIDLAAETFLLYVPPHAPPGGLRPSLHECNRSPLPASAPRR
ncbi:MAG: hypothetical protein ACLPTM_10235 [Steroidobacteraceae bacterium]